MAGTDRLSLLCGQTALTGIDFIQVVEPTLQDRLRVFFVVDPGALNPGPPLVDPATVGAIAPPNEAGPETPEAALNLRIRSLEHGGEVEVESRSWRRIAAPAGERIALDIKVKTPGDFSHHSLFIDDARIDRFFNDVRFSFKQGCPSVFDCRRPCPPEPVESEDVAIDYLARDFWSLRRALLDFTAERHPQWSDPLEADQAVMLMEIMAALGDDFAYIQDRYAREAALPTATQRRSRSVLARLVDYVPDPGLAASTELALTIKAGAGSVVVPKSWAAWARPEGMPAIPFTASDTLDAHPAWNAIDLHCPDGDEPCLPKGAREAFLVSGAISSGQLPAASWIGRRAILRHTPKSAGEPVRAFAVTLTGASAETDALMNPPVLLVRVTWDDPTPWPMRLDETQAWLNILPVRAGREVVERFRVGAAAEMAGLSPGDIPAVDALPPAVEREGPLNPETGRRPAVYRYGLRASETESVGWTPGPDSTDPDDARSLEPLGWSLKRVQPDIDDSWAFLRELLDGDAEDRIFTFEEGMWREVLRHQTPFEQISFQDYAGDEGWTLRFGGGDFGERPLPGVYEITYRTGPGAAANLPPDSVIHLSEAANIAPPPGDVAAVSNPLVIQDGRDEESPDSIRINAPEAFRARPRRAVRPEDFAPILEQADWVQRANATVRWTGSWGSYFLAADPLDGFALSAEQKAGLTHEIDCVRQAGRDARAQDPDYLDIDLEVDLCAGAGTYPGEVVERVTRALTAPGFFSPRNFTFGKPLLRSRLEAAIHAVPGVKGVEEIRLRVRNRRLWEVFDKPALEVEPWQILRLQNDPQFPGRGSIFVQAHGGAP